MKSKIIITIILFIFSFFYLKGGIYLIRENDDLMQLLKEKQQRYNTMPINAIITKHTMIPGLSGKKINLTKSYNKMKGINKFQESLLVFDIIKPTVSINNIYDKVIISGNPKLNKISVITTLNNDYCYTKTLDIDQLCIKNHKYTVHITKISNNYLTKVKELVKNGIIIYIEDKDQHSELDLIMKFLKNNNYNNVPLDELINEEIEG